MNEKKMTDYRLQTPSLVWVYRGFTLIPIILFAHQGFLCPAYIASYRIVMGFVLLPASIAVLMLTWWRRRCVAWFMAAYILMIPALLAILVRLIVLRHAPWWDFLLAIAIVMALPCVVAWCLFREPELQNFYAAKFGKKKKKRGHPLEVP